MIPELGHAALILALLVAALTSVLPLIGAARGDARLIAMARDGALIQALLVFFAFGALMHAFITSDFSLSLVVQHSHSAKPLLYKIAGTWGNHEGSLMLWISVLSAFSAALALFDNRLPEALRARVLAVQAMIATGFLAFILFTSSPFTRLVPAAIEGEGLNPLLQDPGLAFHPPFLYLGYVGFSVTFAFAIAALIEGRVDAAFARWVRPWALAAWSFLSIGIALGSWWAYYTLGWGGFWFWDPVENASFMPWLAGTALIHSALVVERRDALKVWTILLAILTFALSLLGTFLVRSGVLTSVHAFASDPARGLFILVFLIAVVGGALTLFALRAEKLDGGGLFQAISREGALLINNWLLVSATAAVLIGTLYPLLADAIAGDKVTVGPPFFNLTLGALGVPLFLAMALGPLLGWKRGDLPLVLRKMAPAALLAVVVGGLVAYLGDELIAGLGIGLGLWILGGVARDLQGRMAGRLARLFQLSRSAYGAALAHVGVAVSLIGILSTAYFSIERLDVLKPGAALDLGPYRIVFDGAVPVVGPNYLAERGTFHIFAGTREVALLHPETRRFANPPQTTTYAAIHPTWRGDLYVVLGEAGEQGYTARLYLKPLAPLIWLGGALMALGGALALSDRRLRLGLAQRVRQRLVGAAP